MFNSQHILYMVISGLVTVGLLWLFSRYAKTQRQKDSILSFFAVITVLIHISDAWVDYFTSGGQALMVSVHILPIYPCNVVMWMLLVAAMLHNKKGLPFQLLSEFCFFVGTICAVVGIAFNANFDNNPTLADYDILKGMLSHSTMLVGCLYLYIGGYIRVRLFNTVSIIAGLLTFVICGVSMNWLYDTFGMEAPDGMFLRSNPYFPFSPIVPGIIYVIIMFIGLWLHDRYTKKKEMSEHYARTVF